MNYFKNKYCSYCGINFGNIPWPRKCLNCKNISYLNPLPVVAVLIPVSRNGYTGVLIEKRGIEPKKDEWALPCGYIDAGESWQQAAAREIKEEINVISDPSQYKLWSAETATNGNIIIFCHWDIVNDYQYNVDVFKKSFKPNEEVMEIDGYFDCLYNVGSYAKELAFPTHTMCANDFISRFDQEKQLMEI